MRLFVSVDLPDGLADEVRAVQDEFREEDAASADESPRENAPSEDAGLNFVDPGQAHVTLKFLGDVDDADVGDIGGALETAVGATGVDPFDATFEGLGVFPSLDYISVVWLGVGDGSEELARLHEAVEREFVGRGFDPEDHAFTPHVTLARMEHAGRKEHVQSVVRERHPEVGTARVEEVWLTESTLTPSGPVYETVHAVEL